MAAKANHVTAAELAILKLLWERGALTAREIREDLYPRGAPSDHATVQKLLERLERKGHVARDRSTFAHVFRAKVTQAALVGRELEELAEKLTDGSLVPLIMHAVSNQKLSASQRAAIRKLLDGRR